MLTPAAPAIATSSSSCGAGGAAHADGADDLAVDDDRHATDERREVVDRGHGGAALVDQLLEDPGGLLEQRRRAGLADRDVGAGREGAVEPFERHQVAAVVHHGDDAGAGLGAGVGHRGGDDVLRALEVSPLCSATWAWAAVLRPPISKAAARILSFVMESDLESRSRVSPVR